MTKSELIEKVVQTHGMLNMKVSEMLVNTVFDSIEEALKAGDKVEIRGFGSFTIRERTGREARNPKSGEVVPFFMLPAVGGGSSLRGFSSWRFRDRNSLELQAEWRVIVNRFVDMAVFYDTGKVTAHASDLNLESLKNDTGVGFRFHGPLTTPLRIEVAKGNEKVSVIFSASAAF